MTLSDTTIASYIHLLYTCFIDNMCVNL